MRTRGFVRDRLCGPVDLNLASNEMAATAASVTATGTNLVPICANLVPICGTNLCEYGGDVEGAPALLGGWHTCAFHSTLWSQAGGTFRARPAASRPERLGAADCTRELRC